MHLPVRVAVAGADLLGEGPSWDDRTQTLSWVDIKRRRVSTWLPGGVPSVRELPDEVSLSLSCVDARRVVAQVDRLCLDDGVRLTPLCQIQADVEHTRLNDGCCDDDGNLWVGTYSTRGKPEAALHRVTPEGQVTTVVAGMVAANGVQWNHDCSALFVTDTGRRSIDVYVRDHTGTGLARARSLMTVDGDSGLPDGIALDAEGGVWVAMWRGGHLRRYTADGELSEQVPLPVSFPTSLAFGGDDLGTLFVTSARNHLTDPASEPLAGSLLSLRPGVSGLSTRRFGR